MTLRAIILDFGDVIISSHDESYRRAWEDRLGLAPGELANRVFNNPVAEAAVVGLATERMVWQHVCQSLGLDEVTCAQLETDFWRGDVVNHSLIHYVHRLRPRYKTAVLSNAWPMLRYYLSEVFRVSYAFDTIVISAEEGVAKPDPRIYQLTLDRLGLQPHEAVFVDDLAVNIAAARECGLYGIQYQSLEQTLTELEALLHPKD